jgi:molecular chaperone HscA
MGFIELNVLNNAARQIAIGIDLGTTNSLGAMWKDGRPIVLHPEGGSGYVPSALYFAEGFGVTGLLRVEREEILRRARAIMEMTRFSLDDTARLLK